jgi:hypothetical protein
MRRLGDIIVHYSKQRVNDFREFMKIKGFTPEFAQQDLGGLHSEGF